ncbi:MAG: NUDIX hydrolase, partial [Bacillota bacterium]|nr:NUDIX hydrolase [Bacillota bacterium]
EELLSSQEVFRGVLLRVRRDTVRLPEGRESVREVIEHPGAAAVVPVLPGPRLVLLRQYRHAVGRVLWEVPAGKLDPGEDPERCARRELEEEAGYRAGHLERLFSIVTTPGFTNEVIHLFAASDLTLVEEGRRPADEDELLRVEVLPAPEVLEMIWRGELVDAKSIAAICGWAHRAGILR